MDVIGFVNLLFLRRFGNFYPFFKKVLFFSNSSTDFKKRGIYKNTVYIIVCLHTPLVFFALPCCLQPSKKFVGTNRPIIHQLT